MHSNLFLKHTSVDMHKLYLMLQCFYSCNTFNMCITVMIYLSDLHIEYQHGFCIQIKACKTVTLTKIHTTHAILTVLHTSMQIILFTFVLRRW